MNNTPDRVTLIQQALEALEPIFLNVQDDSAAHAGHAGAKSGGGHFTVEIVSKQFEGKSAVKCHQMVYAALGDLMKTDIHAISIVARSGR